MVSNCFPMNALESIYIVGAGGFGREVFAWANQHPLAHKAWELKGFIDDNSAALDHYDYPVPVVGTIDDCLKQGFTRGKVLLAIGDPQTRRAIGQRLLDGGFSLMTLIHPTTVIGENVRFGQGCIICPHCTLTCDITLGDGVILNAHSSIGHDCKVGDWTTLSGHCELTGGCAVGETAFFGCGSHVLPGIRIGDGAHVGAGSVVLQAVPDNTRVFGNPARRI